MTTNRLRRLERLEGRGQDGWSAQFAGITAVDWELIDLAADLPEPWPAETVAAVTKWQVAMRLSGTLRDAAATARL